MPISQDRFIATINAGLDFELGFEFMLKQTADAYYDALDGKIAWQDALTNLATLANHHILKDYGQSKSTLAAEARHFRSNAKRNARQADRLARRRAENNPYAQRRNQPSFDTGPFVGLPRRSTTAPGSIIEDNYMKQARHSILDASPIKTANLDSDARNRIMQEDMARAEALKAKLDAAAKTAAEPQIDLAHDPDDPENFMDLPAAMKQEPDDQ